MNKMTKNRNTLIAIIIAGVVAFYFLLLILLIVFETNCPDSSIHTFRDAVWYSFVTLSTVGYGDMYPVSPQGRLVGYVFVFCSLGVIGLLVGSFYNLINDIRESRRLGRYGTKFTNHIVIFGWDRFAAAVTDQLLKANLRVVMITNQKQQVELIQEQFDSKNVFPLYSEFDKYSYIAEKAQIDSSYAVFLNIGNDTENLVQLINCQKWFKSDLFYSVVIQNSALKETFLNAGATNVFNRDDIPSKLIASYVFEPDVAEYTEDLIASTVESDEYDIQQYLVTDENPFLNKRYDDAYITFREQYESVLIGLVKYRDPLPVLYKNPNDPFLIIEKEDFVIVISNGSGKEKIKADFKVQEGSNIVEA